MHRALGSSRTPLFDWREAPVPVSFPNHDKAAPGPSHLGTGEAADPKRQEDARGSAGPVPTNKGSREGFGA